MKLFTRSISGIFFLLALWDISHNHLENYHLGIFSEVAWQGGIAVAVLIAGVSGLIFSRTLRD